MDDSHDIGVCKKTDLAYQIQHFISVRKSLSERGGKKWERWTASDTLQRQQ